MTPNELILKVSNKYGQSSIDETTLAFCQDLLSDYLDLLKKSNVVAALHKKDELGATQIVYVQNVKRGMSVVYTLPIDIDFDLAV